MSIIENGKKIAGNYKVQLAPEATTEKSGVIRIATDEEILEGIREDLAVTPKQLKSLNVYTKEEVDNKLGDIEYILDNIIAG